MVRPTTAPDSPRSSRRSSARATASLAPDGAWPARGSVVVLVLDGLGWDALEHAPRTPARAGRPRGRAASRRSLPSTTATALTSHHDRPRAVAARPRRLPHARRRRRAERASWQVERPAPARPVRRAAAHAVPRAARCPVVTKSGVPQDAASRERTSAAAGSSAGTRCRRSSSTAAASSRRGSRSSTRTTRASTRSRTSSACTTASTTRSSRSPTALVGDLLDALPAHAALLVTADHGQVHLDADAWIELGAARASSSTQCAGDGRFRYLYARPGAAAELLAAARERARRPARGCAPVSELLDDGLARPAAGRADRGAASATSCSRPESGRVRRPRAAAASAPCVAAHGSLTPDEMCPPPRRPGRPAGASGDGLAGSALGSTSGATSM